MTFRIGEWPGFCAPKIYHPHKKIDRGAMTVDEFFKEQDIEWTFDLENADLWIRKPELSVMSPAAVEDEKKRIEKSLERPTLLLMAEPREHCPVAYHLADPRASMAVAPGSEFKMLYDRGEWVDPQLENWNQRLDKACFIGRPTRERIAFVQKLVSLGVEIDVFSRVRWPLPQWKGPAEDDVADARRYKFRFVHETTQTHLCHSEKLFLGIRSGCITFYHADPQLDLSFCKDAFIPWTEDSWAHRHEWAPRVLEGISRFMFTNAWEIYSYREHYRRIIAEARRVCEENPLRAKEKLKTATLDLGWRTNHKKPEATRLFDGALDLARTGKFREAIAQFQRVREIHAPGELTGILSNLGLLHVHLREFEEAKKYFDLGLARDPDSSDCLLNAGVCFMNQGNHGEALRTLMKIYERGERSAPLCRNLGLTHAHLGHFENAEHFLKESLHAAPQNLETAVDLAGVYLTFGKLQNAEAIVTRVLQMDSQHDRARKIRDAVMAKRAAPAAP